MLSTHRAFVLGLLLPACVVAKSVGEDPETAGLEPETAEGGSAESSTSTTSGSSSSASASSTQSGGGDDTSEASASGSSEVTGFDPSATSSVEETSATSGVSSDSTTTGPVDCGYDPPNWDGPGEYNARCICEACEFQFDDISEDDVLALTEDICDCLCVMGGCGGVVGSSEATTLASTSDVPETDTGDTASTSD